MRVALVSEAGPPASILSAAVTEHADVICLPHLSFSPYVPVALDRAGLECAERSPARSYREAIEHAGDAWLAASVYESENEGVFYVTNRLGRAGGPQVASRQRHVEAVPGRWEQLFWSPGHTAPQLAQLPAGPTAMLSGYDLRTQDAWAEVVSLGARVVIGAASEPADLWARTEQIAAGMAVAHGVTVLAVNRRARQGNVDFPGGRLAILPSGERPSIGEHGIVEIEVTE